MQQINFTGHIICKNNQYQNVDENTTMLFRIEESEETVTATGLESRTT